MNVSKAMQRSFSHTLMALALAAASLQTLAAEPLAAVSSASAPVPVRAGDSALQLPPITARDTLWDIAGRAIAGTQAGVNRNQAIVAILRRNPDAFVGGHVDRLRKGAVLTLPTLAEIRAEDSAKASALMAEQGSHRQAKASALYALTAAASMPSEAVVKPVPAAATKTPVVAAPKVVTPEVATSSARPLAAVSAASVAVAQPPSSPVAVAEAASPVVVSAVASAASHTATATPVVTVDTGAGGHGGDGNAWAWTVGLLIVTIGAGVLVYVLRRAPSEQMMAEAAAVMEAAATKRASLRAPTTVSTAALDLAKKLEQNDAAVLMVQKEGAVPPQVPNVLAESALRLVLARAYLELKDRDASRKQLEIVLREGDEGQKEEAQGAMARL
ncbi:MAG: FimV/HubP family polar landmark protein [Leptothrix ochracea]|uniref:FimV/HubP family polar landmark protein n=1 Tax=Leptothrix ochracea TaxID=735331 RepID=UPI0034E234FF